MEGRYEGDKGRILRSVDRAITFRKLSDKQLVGKTMDSIETATLPGGVTVPPDIKKSCKDLVVACDARLSQIEHELKVTNLDLSVKEALKEEKQNMRDLLIQIYEANIKPKRTWEEFWNDNEALCALVKPEALAREILLLLAQAIAVAIIVAAVALPLIFILASPLGWLLAGITILVFCAYKFYSAWNAISKAWDKSNENLANRQLDQGQDIKDRHNKMVNDTLAEANKAKKETAGELSAAEKELEQASQALDEENKALITLQQEQAEANVDLDVGRALLAIDNTELDRLVGERNVLVAALGANPVPDQARINEIKRLINENNEQINNKRNEIAPLQERVAKAEAYPEKIATQTQKRNAAALVVGVIQGKVDTARDKDTAAGTAVTNAEKAVNNLTRHLTPLQKASAPANINPATGRKMDRVNPPKYQPGFTQSNK